MIAGKPSSSRGAVRMSEAVVTAGHMHTGTWHTEHRPVSPPTRTPWHAKANQPKRHGVFASTSATLPSCAGCCPGARLSLPQFPLCIPTLCKITQPYHSSSLSPIVFLPNPQFLPSQLFTMDEEQQDGKGKGFS